IALVASLDSGTFGDVVGAQLELRDDAGKALLRFQIDEAAETALLFGEIYRRDQKCRFRAVGQGWASGLAGLATDFGITVSDEPTPDGHPSHEEARSPAGIPSSEEQDPAAADPPLGPAQLPPPAVADPDSEVVELQPDGHEVPADDPAEDLVGVVAKQPQSTLSDAAAPDASSGEASPSDGSPADVPRPASGVRTRKVRPRPVLPLLKLAPDESWQASRLFSIAGVGPAAEQEKRATSALLATMMGVRSFARGITARLGAPAGLVETYLEVPFALGEATVQPDGVLRVARGGRIWTGLVETKTGNSPLRREQVENYLDVARVQGFDAVITISNEIASAAGLHPVDVDRRKLRKVALHHLSWAEVLHEARMLLAHGGLTDPLQAWLLQELVRYLTHPRSGAVTFSDMGPAWVAVREAVAAGTLRSTDRKTPVVVEAWARLVRQLSLELTADLGATVSQVLPRRLAVDPATRLQADSEGLATAGILTATLRVPDTAGPLTVVADLRTSQVRVSAPVRAPLEGSAQRRVGWLLRQLGQAPDGLLVEVLFGGQAESTCELLQDVRDKPASVLRDRNSEVASFVLTHIAQLGTKRSGIRGAFIPSVLGAVETFYRFVLQPIRPWTPPAPKLPAGSLTGIEERAGESAQPSSAPTSDGGRRPPPL
ncbi:MAG: TerD family protein, partial [Actinomycetota bacterium]|nr:TerD family protein [Actinomycetota bacterium]